VKKNRWEVKWTIEHWTEIEKESEYYGMFFIHGYGEMKYLHELQNYYYLFEKQDLTIKL
jgi:hypothetical protein